MEKIHEVHEATRAGVRKFKGPRYYDHPDGEDLLGKLSYTTKLAAAGTSLFGILYANLSPIPKTWSGKFLRYFMFVGPAVGMAATFTIVTYYSTNVRKKDDELNYALGGAAAGLILGPALGLPQHIGWFSLGLATVGYIKKSVELEGKKLMPDTRRGLFPSYYLRSLDSTIYPDNKRGNWTKEPAP